MSTKVHYSYGMRGADRSTVCRRPTIGMTKLTLEFDEITCKNCISRLVKRAEQDIAEIQDDIKRLRSIR